MSGRLALSRLQIRLAAIPVEEALQRLDDLGLSRTGGLPAGRIVPGVRAGEWILDIDLAVDDPLADPEHVLSFRFAVLDRVEAQGWQYVGREVVDHFVGHGHGDTGHAVRLRPDQEVIETRAHADTGGGSPPEDGTTPHPDHVALLLRGPARDSEQRGKESCLRVQIHWRSGFRPPAPAMLASAAHRDPSHLSMCSATVTGTLI